MENESNKVKQAFRDWWDNSSTYDMADEPYLSHLEAFTAGIKYAEGD